MPISYRIFKSHGLVFAEGSDPLTDDDIASHAFQLLNDPDFEPSLYELLDLSGISVIDLSSEGMFRTATEVVKHRERLIASRLAIVAPTDEMYGMARMYELMLSTHLEGIQVFRTVEPALEYLGFESSLPAVLRQTLVR